MSPVVGVVVLVAIAVVLSTITIATVTNFGNNTDENAQAGVSVDYKSESIIELQLNNKQTADQVLVKSPMGTEYEFSEVGDTIRILNAETNTTPTVIGEHDGERTLLQQVPPHSFEPDLTVDSEGSEEYDTIEDAIANASDGDIMQSRRKSTLLTR